jgi:hypothetical protein
LSPDHNCNFPCLGTVGDCSTSSNDTNATSRLLRKTRLTTITTWQDAGVAILIRLVNFSFAG